MTYNEFKFCCIIFRNQFEGKKCGEVIEYCFPVMRNFVIGNTLKIDNIRFRFDTQETILYFQNEYILINLLSRFKDPSFKTVEDFLNHLKITLKDIV